MGTATTALTRTEAAYAHLASFTKDERVIIGGRGLASDEAAVKTPQCALSGDMTSAFLIAAVTGGLAEGGWARISVADLLSGARHIEHDGDRQWNGQQTWFDSRARTCVYCHTEGDSTSLETVNPTTGYVACKNTGACMVRQALGPAGPVEQQMAALGSVLTSMADAHVHADMFPSQIAAALREIASRAEELAGKVDPR